MRRFVVHEGSIAGGELLLDGDVASHVRDVLRARPGEKVLLSDGSGVEAEAEIAELSKAGVRVRVGALRALPPPTGTALTIIQCVAKGDKIDQMVRQCAELGVRAIVPVIASRSVAEKRSRVDRWRAIAEDAIRVSGRAHRPRIEDVQTFDAMLARPRADVSFAFALEGEQSFSQALFAKPARTVEALIGPEGGLTAEELERARSCGFSIVHLGPHTLRTETAGPAIAAVVLLSRS